MRIRPTADRFSHPGNDFEHLRADLDRLGVRRGSVLVVQASLRSVAPVSEDPEIVVRALSDVLGPDGTLVVPTFTTLNSTTSRAHKDAVLGMSLSQVESYLGARPPFDPATTPSELMGALAECVRTWPGAVRSVHPHTSFAAVGPQAADLMAVHELACHLGPQSPVGRLHDLAADSLLLGLDYHQGCTMIHLAEYLVAARRAARGLPVTRRNYQARMAGFGAPGEWILFQDLDLDDGDFSLIGAAYEAAVGDGPGLRRGMVGSAPSRLVASRQIIRFAAEWMLSHRSFGEERASASELAAEHDRAGRFGQSVHRAVVHGDAGREDDEAARRKGDDQTED
ncbi:MAG TPA: AAC(3) family N-acetyltransferase [Actinocrinis sp.]|nr:AAC(3) family N-acetyltransferase [Actinocrinis sp.]